MPDGLVLISKLVGAVPFLALTARYNPAPSRPSANSPRAARARRPRDRRRRPLPQVAGPARGTAEYRRRPAGIDLRHFESVPDDAGRDLTAVPGFGRGAVAGRTRRARHRRRRMDQRVETITNPSRLFGYAGYYTHVELGPYVKGSIATYLKARGYQTLALYPVEGKFSDRARPMGITASTVSTTARTSSSTSRGSPRTPRSSRNISPSSTRPTSRNRSSPSC